ncbi:MAG: histidine phosphatase family protein [Planktotalea sp.]|uniref:histidine phosphatase family protein n=1 Tax=Planktotalea sp. TaxID=2029877 RepID=UPI00261EEE24|nr:histidine phosphatase family protein [Planktotalea sp.]MDG1083513.1 histidine phosphatase family protein [Planktotalea sp.]
MTEITLVRHGQANSNSTDEHGYDKLSPLGHEQAAWLGTHLRDTHRAFDSVYCGTLRRHIETASGMQAADYAPVTQDARLNELAYFDLSNAFEAYSGQPIPTQQADFVAHMPRLFEAWMDGHLQNIPESFASFEDRVSQAIEDISARRDRALVITSGGVIGLMTRQVLSLDTDNYARTCLSIMNSSTHRFTKIGPKLSLSQFNNISHLEQIGRHHAQTHI